VYPSEANYLLVKFKEGQKVFQSLWAQGIILRDQHKALNLQHCVRITVGTKEENDRVLEAIEAIK
ncbi:aminotransferase class I/II-fold pyridoxal phosphate-dependent enzyme, partial [Rodentibacter pneumotropicus]